MKRSTINACLRQASELLQAYHFSLPEFAFWTPSQWLEHRDQLDVIRAVRLGWEFKNFSSMLGATLFTLRNGKHDDPSVGVHYCEKVIVFQDGKRLPLHYHLQKTEDVINRAAGIMEIRLYNTTPEGALDIESDVFVRQDGILHHYRPGEPVYILPGNSITLPPRLAHCFGPKAGAPLIVGEVSQINNDLTDNIRFEQVPAPEPVEEDEAILYPLCTEYDSFFKNR